MLHAPSKKQHFCFCPKETEAHTRSTKRNTNHLFTIHCRTYPCTWLKSLLLAEGNCGRSLLAGSLSADALGNTEARGPLFLAQLSLTAPPSPVSSTPSNPSLCDTDWLTISACASQPVITGGKADFKFLSISGFIFSQLVQVWPG